MAKIAIVANYAAGKNQLEPLVKYLRAKDIEVDAALSINAPPLSKERCEEMLFGASSLVCSMAPNEIAAALELEAVETAMRLDIPVFLYCDAFGTCSRPWFKNIVTALYDKVTFLLPAKSEEHDVRTLYPEAKYVTVGNPEWFVKRIPTHTKRMARKKLGLSQSGTVILYGGTKAEFADIHVLGLIADAVIRAPAITRPVSILYTMHPGSFLFGEGRKDENEVRRLFGSLVVLPPLFEAKGVRVNLIDKVFSTEICQCAADLVAEIMSISGVIAVLREQPLITFMTQIFHQNHLYHTGGKFNYPLVETGSSVFNPSSEEKLVSLILDLLNDGPTRQVQLKKQREFFEDMSVNPIVLMARALLPDMAGRFE